MLSSLFRWIYCLNIPVFLMMLIAASAAFAWSYCRYSDRYWYKPIVGVLLLISIAAILTVALFMRIGNNTVQEALLIPFGSYHKVLSGGTRELLRSNFMNVVLFYPAGLFTSVLLPRRWRPLIRVMLVILVFALMSMVVEQLQYLFVLGQPDVDDIIHNIIGAMIGGSVASLIMSYKKQDS